MSTAPRMVWHSPEHVPNSARVVVGLTPLIMNTRRDQFWAKHFVQYSDGKWGYAGSDQGCRDLKYWCDLPELPKE